MNLGREDDNRIAERAAQYLGALTESDAPREAFFAWLSESPRHVEEFLWVLRSAQDIAAISSAQAARIEALAGEAIADENGGTVIPLEKISLATVPRIVSGRTQKRWAIAVALAAALTIAIPVGWRFSVSFGDAYTTAIGEQRALKLADGSMVFLNTDSRLRVRFTRGARSLKLVQGEALFKVSPDSARPFRVQAGDSLIQAVGTQFDVYRLSTGTRVSVLEGSVQISAAAIPVASRSHLNAGEAVSLSTAGTVVRRERLNADKAVAWRQRRLIFEEETLGNIAAEFNRYNASPRIQVIGDAATEQHFSGTFDADTPERLVNTLLGDDTFIVTRTDREITIRAR